jgi:hypothetical protein
LIKTNDPKRGGRLSISEQAAEAVDEWQPAEGSKYHKQELL